MSPRTAALCAAVLASGVTFAVAPEAGAPGPAPTLVCGAYTMANDDLTGCEVLPQYLDWLARMTEPRVFTAVNAGGGA